MDELHDRMWMATGKISFRQIGSMTGTHPETVRRYMQGQAPSVAFVVAFAQAFGVGIEWLLTGRGPMRPAEVPVQSLRSVGLDALLKAVGDRLSELEAAGTVGGRDASPAVEPKRAIESIAAASTAAVRSSKPLEDIRRCLAERRRVAADHPSGDHYDAA